MASLIRSTAADAATPPTGASFLNATLRFGRTELIASLVGILAYGGIAWLSNFSGLAGSLGVDIRPAVAIPIAMGFIYGPIVGFLSGMFGNILADVLMGGITFTSYPPVPATGDVLRDVFAAYFLNWQIGNGISGFIPGIMALYHRRYQTSGDLLQVGLYIVLAAGVGMGAMGIIGYWAYPGLTPELVFNEAFWPAFQHNVIVSLVLVPLTLYNLQRVDFSGSRDWLNSGLLRKLLLAVFLAALIPTLLLGFFLSQQERAGGNTGLLVQLGVTVFITLFFTTLNALGLAQTLSRPLLRLTESANLMQQGKLPVERAQALSKTVGDDELSQLSRLFGTMAQEVIEREARLKQQVESLKIEIDQAKQIKQVEEITDNEFFRDLQTKARTLRSSRGTGTTAADSSAVLTSSSAPTGD